MPTYNGHKNWNHWNVSLWISNDEGLYRLALQFIREAPTRDKAAELLLSELRAGGHDKTPRRRTLHAHVAARCSAGVVVRTVRKQGRYGMLTRYAIAYRDA